MVKGKHRSRAGYFHCWCCIPVRTALLFRRSYVFRYLCLTNLKDAIIVYNEYTNATQVDTSLITFLRYLLKVLKRDAYPLLKELQTRYALTLRRDPDYLKVSELLLANWQFSVSAIDRQRILRYWANTRPRRIIGKYFEEFHVRFNEQPFK